MVQLSSLLRKLHAERNHHLAAVSEIDAVFARFGIDPETGGEARRGPGRPRGSKNKKKPGRKKAGSKKKASKKKTAKKRTARGKKAGGQRVQGVKQTLQESLTSTPQSPAELADKVSKKVGQKVSITTQLHMLKRDGVAKAVGRGQWVKA